MREHLSIGDSVKVTLQRGSNSNEYLHGMSKVEEITDENIELQMPMDSISNINCAVGTQLWIDYINKNTTVPETMETIVIGVKRGRVPTIIVNNSSKIIMTQRRYYVRVPAVLPVTLDETINAYTINISACGALIGTDVDKEIGETVQTRLIVDDKHITSEARIVRKGDKRFSLNFIDLDSRDEDIIIKFVLERQRAEIQKKFEG